MPTVLYAPTKRPSHLQQTQNTLLRIAMECNRIQHPFQRAITWIFDFIGYRGKLRYRTYEFFASVLLNQMGQSAHRILNIMITIQIDVKPPDDRSGDISVGIVVKQPLILPIVQFEKFEKKFIGDIGIL